MLIFPGNFRRGNREPSIPSELHEIIQRAANRVAWLILQSGVGRTPGLSSWSSPATHESRRWQTVVAVPQPSQVRVTSTANLILADSARAVGIRQALFTGRTGWTGRTSAICIGLQPVLHAIGAS